MMMKTAIYVIFVVAVMLCGCRREPTIEDVPVGNIATSQPPEYEVKKAPEPVLNTDGVYRLSEVRYFGAVVPFGAIEKSCTEEECRFYVPGMMQGDVERFLKKYFPYQKLTYYPRVVVYDLLPELKPEYAEDGIIPTFDPNIEKPTPENAMEMHIYWDRQEMVYQWIYKNPFKRPVQLEEIQGPDIEPEDPVVPETGEQQEEEEIPEEIRDMYRVAPIEDVALH